MIYLSSRHCHNRGIEWLKWKDRSSSSFQLSRILVISMIIFKKREQSAVAITLPFVIKWCTAQMECKQIPGGTWTTTESMFLHLGLPRLSQGLRTAVCQCSNVPAVWLGHRAIRLALEPELEPEVQTGLLSPRHGRILMARRPHCPDSNIRSRTICWGCPSRHSPHTPDLSKESPMGAQAINALLGWFWSPFERNYGTIKNILSPQDAIFAATYILIKRCGSAHPFLLPWVLCHPFHLASMVSIWPAIFTWKY